MKLSEIEAVTEGITHVEDLAVDEFIDAIRNFDKYEISEKVDGSNIQFGIDKKGFYTSREEFGGTRIYNIDDYPVNFATTFQRSAHAALEKVLPVMEREGGLTMGDRVEAEVLYGELPNAIRYTNETNRIILLRVIEGDVNMSTLKKALDDKNVAVTLKVPFTVDGKSIKLEDETNIWSFEQTPSVSSDSVSQGEAMSKINDILDNMEAYLKKPSGVYEFSNAEILALPLNKRPDNVQPQDWKEVKAKVKAKRQEVQQVVYHEDKDTGERVGFKAQVKDVLLNELVRKIKSDFGPEIEDGGWIEGVVFKHKDTGEQFKVVDKDMFTSIKDFLWKVRKEIADNPKSLKNVESFLGKVMTGLASSLGHPELGTTQAKRYLKKLGDTKDEILSSLTSDVNYETVKQYWIKFLDEKKKTLNDRLEKYNQEKHEHTMTLDLGDLGQRTYHYDDEIDKRTLQVFASLYERLDKIENGIKKAKSAKDLAMLLIGRQISEL